MATLQVLMPMGGLGTRFRKVGVTTPKPLIEVGGVPMFQRALRSFDPWQGPKTVTVVVREDNDREFDLAARVRGVEPSAEIVLLDHDTRGAVETCLVARDRLDPDQPLVIMDCDIAFDSPEWFRVLERAVQAQSVDGLLLSFRSSEPRYSFAEVDDAGLVTRTAEKQAISSDALMGVYSFATTRVFLDAADRLMARQIDAAMPEYYVSLVFNELIDAGRRVGLAHGDFYCFGTPEELAAFEATGAPV
ncbi:glycosyltransferase family 2 protein [Modestobacter roseus]|uniref:MobA-like NTP transferase protein n=1 Tax=Modestobacter roseus TaxID=1181884 RepID=A0A562IUJ9_9ACTN|nr:glycosyltransferase family 2 protein [Modestobacter roseus]MQA33279.1 NTP transferase domain-containing protein [Modestobacter roseus]TWH74204.1 MobA-like NTP transferase protein [Modestobacter roseus]